MSAQAYKQLLKKLLPPGLALTREPDSNVDKVLQASADELCRADERGADLIAEFPATTTEMLSDWERALGLPDECAPAEQTETARRLAVIARLTEVADITPAGIEAYVARGGFEATVEEFDAFEVGVNAVGAPVAGEDWQFAWRLNVEGVPDETALECGIGECGDLLLDFGIPAVECLIERINPAHLFVMFGYSGEWPSEETEVSGGMYTGGGVTDGDVVTV